MAWGVWVNDHLLILGNHHSTTDGTVIGTRAGYGTYDLSPETNLSDSLRRFCTIFQAEIYASLICTHQDIDMRYKNRYTKQGICVTAKCLLTLTNSILGSSGISFRLSVCWPNSQMWCFDEFHVTVTKRTMKNLILCWDWVRTHITEPES